MCPVPPATLKLKKAGRVPAFFKQSFLVMGLGNRFGDLHIAVIRSTSAFWHHPSNVLGRILNVAGLAVNAVLRIDLKAGAVCLLDDFIHARRTIALSWLCIFRQVATNGQIWIGKGQMTGLILLVIGA